MKWEIKIVCARCGKLIAVKEGGQYVFYTSGHWIEIGKEMHFVCEDCYKEYKKLKEELGEDKEKKIIEWFEKEKND